MSTVENPRAVAGGNAPPDTIQFARDAYRDLTQFLAKTPAILSHEDAAAAGLLIERTRKLFQDMEDERTKLVKPLNDEVDEINGRYHTVHNVNAKKPGILDKVLTELRTRLAAYMKAEEDRRFAEAEAKRIAAEEAEARARDAERIETEAKEAASVGECGVQVGTAIANADKAFAEFERADREFARAVNDVQVRVASRLGGNALSLRTKETLVLVDAAAAIAEIGATPKITDAILSGARDFRKLKGRLPNGVTATTDQTI